MLTGLEHAHEKVDNEGIALQVVHRDISPANILVSYEGEVKVADFGIAKAKSQAVDTKDGVLKGKFEYMSPLQAQGKQVDHRTDIFSTGIVLWEMLTGRRLFKTDSDVATLEKIKAGNYPPPSALNPRICGRLDSIVSKALAHREADRYQTAREFADALESYLYPSTPNSVQRSLKNFMGRIFSMEISSEREALTAGSIVAAELYAQPETFSLLDDWDDDLTLTKPKRSLGLWGILIGLLAIGGVAYWTSSKPPEPHVAPPPNVARMTLHIEPGHAVVAEGDTILGVGPVLRIEDMPLGDHRVRVEAHGYITETEQVFIVAGEHLVQRIRLRPTVVEPEGTDPAPTPGNGN
jgi:serine/threonine protein kinase